MRINIVCKKYSSFLLLISSLVLVSLISCSDSEQGEEKSTSARKTESYKKTAKTAPAREAKSFRKYEETADTTNRVRRAESSRSNKPKSNKLDDYTVALGADGQMKYPGISGELRVWIGSSKFKPNFPSRMVEDTATVAAVGESARIEPFAPAFKIIPAETQCIKIHPSGSVVRFELIPQSSGTFNVSATVYLFDSLDCSGSPIPKTAATVKVTVEVNNKEIFLEKANELWVVFWEKLLEFWAALVALIFALILFSIRGRLKQWFGFKNK